MSELLVAGDVVRVGGHDYRREGGRIVHLAGCSCWRAVPATRPATAVDACRFCKREHEEGVTCRWATWLNFGRAKDAGRRRA